MVDYPDRETTWRRAGIDARPLRLNLRHLPGQRVVAAGVSEPPPEKKSNNHSSSKSEKIPSRDGTVRLDFHDTSATSKGKRHGGDFADTPKATITTADTTVTITPKSE